jgi:hypothetical protein
METSTTIQTIQIDFPNESHPILHVPFNPRHLLAVVFIQGMTQTKISLTYWGPKEEGAILLAQTYHGDPTKIPANAVYLHQKIRVFQTDLYFFDVTPREESIDAEIDAEIETIIDETISQDIDEILQENEKSKKSTRAKGAKK